MQPLATLLVLGLLGLSAGACTSPRDEEAPVGMTQQTMYACDDAPTPTITSDATTGYDATVGEIRGPTGFCSAVAITRNSAVTARHCFPQYPDVAGWTFSLPQAGGYEAHVTEIITHPHAWDIADHECAGGYDGEPGGSIEGAIADVAIVWFGPEPIPPSVMAKPADVFFSSSLHLAVPPPAIPVITGFGLSINAEPPPLLTYDGQRRRGQVGGVEFESDQSCLPGWDLQAALCAYEDGVIGAHGDSGGGLFLVSLSDPTQAKLIGIKSGTESDPFTYETWASTSIRRIYTEDWADCVFDCALDQNLPGCECESTSNGALILQGYGEDADGDGFVDEYDNCPPSWCVDFLGKAPEDCYDPAGTDSDGDGRGDICDPCPNDSLYGGGEFPFYDADGDGRPDPCDNCPHYPTSGELTDTDGDGVGNECDCSGPEPTPYPHCNTQADCAGISAGHCIFSFHGDHCSRLPDGDSDGLFDACDGCPGNPNDGLFGITANSNLDAEERWAASLAPVPDPCDVVPQMALRPNGLPYEDKDALCTVPGASTMAPCIDDVRFTATRAVGSLTEAISTFPSGSGEAPVGFRHCDCYDNGNALERAQCMALKCYLVSNDYNFPGIRYDMVTVAHVSGNLGTITYPSSPTSPYIQRSFSSEVSQDFDLHPSDGIPGSNWEGEIWRIGPKETITWRVKHDIDAGHVVGHGPDGDETAGIFWSIVLTTPGLVASTRDDSTGQRLRSTYSYLKTPVLGLPFDPAAYPDFALSCKLCSIVVSPEQALVNPAELAYHWPFAGPVRIVAFGDELAMRGGPDRATLDASPFLSPAVRRLLLGGQTRWLAPVESGVATRRLRPESKLVALPQSWDDRARVFEVLERDGLLQLAGEIVGPDVPNSLDGAALAAAEPAVDPAVGTAIVPGPRTGERALLSLETRALLLVGGKVGSLPASGEIWRYQLDTRLWEQMSYDPPKIETLKALAYDGRRQWLLAVDEVDESLFSESSADASGGMGKILVCHDPPGQGAAHTIEIAAAALLAHLAHGDGEGPCEGDGIRTLTRLVVVSLASGRAALLASWAHPRAGGEPLRRYERLALGALGEGSFLLLGSRADGEAIEVFGLELGPGGAVSWTGSVTVPGRLLEEPVRTANGLDAPVWRDGAEALVSFTVADLVPSTSGPEGF